MISKMYKAISLLLAAVFLLAACAPAQVTPNPADVQKQVASAVAMTVEAQNAQTQAAQPTITSTTEPTSTVAATITPILPTATPFVVTPPSSGGGSSGGGVAPTYKYACDVVGQRPRDNTEFHPGDSFDVKWTIVNTGTETWPAGYDLKYYSGPRMTSATVVQLPEIKPGKTYSVVFDAQAPAEKGFQVMTWTISGFCFPYVAIVVK